MTKSASTKPYSDQGEGMIERLEREMLSATQMALRLPAGPQRTTWRSAAAEWATILIALRSTPSTPETGA